LVSAFFFTPKWWLFIEIRFLVSNVESGHFYLLKSYNNGDNYQERKFKIEAKIHSTTNIGGKKSFVGLI